MLHALRPDFRRTVLGHASCSTLPGQILLQVVSGSCAWLPGKAVQPPGPRASPRLTGQGVQPIDPGFMAEVSLLLPKPAALPALPRLPGSFRTRHPGRRTGAESGAEVSHRPN